MLHQQFIYWRWKDKIPCAYNKAYYFDTGVDGLIELKRDPKDWTGIVIARNEIEIKFKDKA